MLIGRGSRRSWSRRADLEQGRPDSGHPMLFDLAVQLLAIIRPTRP
jgi:hypothetical protein